MKVSELIQWLNSLDPEFEIGYLSKEEEDGFEEISHIEVDEKSKVYRLI